MNKINRIFTTITISIIILFSIAIIGTYLSDYLISINWFGDYDRTYYSTYTLSQQIEHKWGARHYWYNCGVALLWITSLVRAFVTVIAIIEEE